MTEGILLAFIAVCVVAMVADWIRRAAPHRSGDHQLVALLVLLLILAIGGMLLLAGWAVSRRACL